MLDPSIAPPGGLASRRLDRPFMVVAWVAISGLFTLTVLEQNAAPDEESRHDDVLGLRVMEFQSRYLVGTQELARSFDDGQGASLIEAAESFDTGTFGQRLRFAALAGELDGPSEALARLEQIETELAETDFTPRPAQWKVFDELVALYEIREAEGDESSVDREFLRGQLGWFGELAVTPATADPASREAVIGSARRLLWGVISLIVVGGVALFVGFVLLVIGVVSLAIGLVRFRLEVGETRGGLYAELFAIWLGLFLLLSSVLAGAFSSLGADAMLPAGVAAMLGSLAAVAWPVLRGESFAQVRRDLGWHTGRGLFREVGAGVASYCMALPMLVVGITIMLVLMFLSGASSLLGGGADAQPFSANDTPAHPLIEIVASGGVTAKVLAVILACVCAPIVEETMFRGALHRHLREGTRRGGAALSILASAFIGAFVFAAVHPQGWIAIPALMSLAIGFTLGREWRDSLIPGMVAHAINNGAVVTLLILAFG